MLAATYLVLPHEVPDHGVDEHEGEDDGGEHSIHETNGDHQVLVRKEHVVDDATLRRGGRREGGKEGDRRMAREIGCKDGGV